MKIFASLILMGLSLSTFAGVCDVKSYNDEIARVNAQFDNFEIRAEDQHIAITLIERLKGQKVLTCVLEDNTSNLSSYDILLAIPALQAEVYDEIRSLDNMLEYYETAGNYLMVEKVREEKDKVYKRQADLNEKIKNLAN